MILGVIDFVRKVEPGLHDLYRKQDLYRAPLADILVANLGIVTKASRSSPSLLDLFSRWEWRHALCSCKQEGGKE